MRRQVYPRWIGAGFGGNTGEVFMHRDCVPLDQADIRSHAERGQPDLFGNECEGMCGPRSTSA